ncbi:MAG: hypothetical protein V1808_01010 [Candidatus Daviesbacteria bacterium]
MGNEENKDLVWRDENLRMAQAILNSTAIHPDHTAAAILEHIAGMIGSWRFECELSRFEDNMPVTNFDPIMISQILKDLLSSPRKKMPWDNE